MCVKFNALYDIVKNTFEGVRLLDYNIDVLNGSHEKRGFIKMGRALGKGYMKTLMAYKKAKRAQQSSEKQRYALQAKALECPTRPKILIVSHPYNTYDKLIDYPIAQYIEKLGGLLIYADAADRKKCLANSKYISQTLYWIYSKELIGSLSLLKDKIDGIILMTAFPCGPDSLVNELIIRKSDIPTINIVLDELEGEAGLQTRLESFMDILQEKLERKAV